MRRIQIFRNKGTHQWYAAHHSCPITWGGDWWKTVTTWDDAMDAAAAHAADQSSSHQSCR